MNTTPAAPAPITHRIADKAPEFPCWVWDSRKWIYERLRTFPTDTHWCSGIPAERPTHAPESQAQGPSDSEMLDWLIAECYFPDDHPKNGIFLCAGEDAIPHGGITLNPIKDAKIVRAAIASAMKGGDK